MKKEVNKSKKIKALIFDMNGVLVLGIELKRGSRLSNSFHQRIARKIGISIDTWFDAIDAVYADSIEGKISEKRVLNTISKNLDLKPERLERLILKNYKNLFKRNNELHKYAFRMKKKGYRIAILSDQWHLSKKALLKENDVKRFDVSIISCDVGIRKPNPRIYRLTLRKLGVKPSEAVFIDNRDWNTKAAEKLGIKTVLFKNNSQFKKELDKLLR
jgi:epoxide hydrolase-like predicted phosphatase